MLQPFRCRVLINDIVDKTLVTDTYGAIQVTKEDLIREADFISLHVPLTDLTYQLVNQSFLAQMKPSAFLINTSRGPVVEQAALKKAMQQGRIAGAALDVFDLPQVSWTPLIGASCTTEVIYGNKKTLRRRLQGTGCPLGAGV